MLKMSCVCGKELKVVTTPNPEKLGSWVSHCEECDVSYSICTLEGATGQLVGLSFKAGITEELVKEYHKTNPMEDSPYEQDDRV